MRIPKTLLVALVAATVSLFVLTGVAQAMPKCPNGSTPAQNTEYPNTEMSLSAQESGLYEGNHGEYANGTATYNVYTDKEGFFFFMQEYTFAATPEHEAFSYKKDAPLCGKEMPGKPPHEEPKEEEKHEPPPHEKEKEIVKEKEVVKEKEREIVHEGGSESTSEATACSTSSGTACSSSVTITLTATCEQIMPASVCKPSPPAPAPETCQQTKTCKPPHHHAKCVDNRGSVSLSHSPNIAPAFGSITIRLMGSGTRHLRHVRLHIDQAAYGSFKDHGPFVWVIPVTQFASPQGRLYGNHGVKVTGNFKCSKVAKSAQIFSNDPPGHIRK